MARPSKYDPAFCECVIELGREGKSRAQMAAAIGVERTTLRAWAKERPDFAAALDFATDLSMAWWEDRGVRGMSEGKDFNAAVWKHAIAARFPEEYGERSEVRHSGGVLTANMTPEQIQAELVRLRLKHAPGLTIEGDYSVLA